MDQAFFCILFFLLSQHAALSKYVLVKNGTTWPEAQTYCEDFYTDLAPVSNEEDNVHLQKLAGNNTGDMWIGMERSSSNEDTWLWSGGGEVSKFFWAPGQPDNQQDENVVSLNNYLWSDANAGRSLPFFCYRAVVVNETMTWEEAMQYCKDNHHNLASVASETEMLLIQKELDKYVTTDQVWIGLRFLPERWIWVDGRPLNYEAWGQNGKPSCSKFTLKCGALNIMQGTQSSNGNSALVQVGSVAVRSGDVRSIVVDTGLTSSDQSNKPASTKQIEWEAHDCEEKLNFVCY